MYNLLLFSRILCPSRGIIFIVISKYLWKKELAQTLNYKVNKKKIKINLVRKFIFTNKER